MRFFGDLWAARAAFSLVAAVDLDVFTPIAGGRRTAAEIAKAVKGKRDGVTRLLDLLVAMGYLTKDRDGGYDLTDVSATFLVRGKPSYLGDLVAETRLSAPAWMQLADVIRTGKPVEAVDSDAGREFFPKLVRAIFPLSFGASSALVASLPKRRLASIHRVLDVAAGSAAWSLPFLSAIPNARAVAADYPEVTPIVREYAEQFGVADRYEYLEGNLREVDFGKNAFDVVLLGHILHSEGEKWGKRLVKRSFQALKPGGMIVVAEMVPDDDRRGPVFPLLFGLNMLVHTSEGAVWTKAELTEWLTKAGFAGVKAVVAPAPSPLLIATKPA